MGYWCFCKIKAVVRTTTPRPNLNPNTLTPVYAYLARKNMEYQCFSNSFPTLIQVNKTTWEMDTMEMKASDMDMMNQYEGNTQTTF